MLPLTLPEYSAAANQYSQTLGVETPFSNIASLQLPGKTGLWFCGQGENHYKLIFYHSGINVAHAVS